MFPLRVSEWLEEDLGSRAKYRQRVAFRKKQSFRKALLTNHTPVQRTRAAGSGERASQNFAGRLLNTRPEYEQRAMQPGGGRCATSDTAVILAVTTKTNVKVIIIFYDRVTSSSQTNPRTCLQRYQPARQRPQPRFQYPGV